MVEVLKMNII